MHSIKKHILSVFFKILEKIVYKQLEHYLKEKVCYINCNKVLNHFFLLVLFLWIMRSEIDFGNYIGMVIGMQKAFDTVDHSIL